MLKLLDECQHLPKLTRLYFYACYIRDSLANSQLVIDKIWSLPNLTNCFFNIHIENEDQFSLPTTISISLERVAINDFRIQWNDINQLIQYTPRLKNLFLIIII